ncbi:MAG: hypothetical protein D4R63_12025 [Methylococcaceae bacterium]|jgi:hypothetical protein|nr:MAG: hypothetical protein D4R63_12025 [Methylococcaceae bacterium]
MKTKIQATVTLALIAIISTSAQGATCTQADLAGQWRVYFHLSSATRCTIITPTTGTAIKNTSTCYVPGVTNSVPLTGNLSIYSDCHVTGKVAASGYTRQIDAYISKGKDSMSGIGWDPNYHWDGGVFSAVKQ